MESPLASSSAGTTDESGTPTGMPIGQSPPKEVAQQANWEAIRQNLNAPAGFAPDWVPSSAPATESPTRLATPAPLSPAAPNLAASGQFGHGSHSPLESGVRIDIELPEDDEEEEVLASALDASPPWLISLVVHMVLIVVLGLLAISTGLVAPLDLEISFDTVGEQLDRETIDIADMQIDDAPVVTPTDMTVSDDPLASPHSEALQIPDQILSTAPFEAPNVGLALSGREQGMKQTLLLAYGGTEITETAVADALKWLERQQLRNGAWRLDGPYGGGSSQRNPVAATAMALLAFQGAGFTHQTTRTVLNKSGDGRDVVDYRKVVSKGWDEMLSWQAPDGNFWRKGGVDHPHHKLYSHAQATIALCELYGMTRDKTFRKPAQRAVDYCCEIQDDDGVFPDGGWKYDPGEDSDTSVTGWFVMALQSARMAGLDVPSDVFAKVSEFLDSVTEEGTYYAYMPGYQAKHTLTAEALLCRQYLGWKRDDPRLVEGVEYLAEIPIDWSDTNSYYWYYATQVMHHMEGDFWFDWNHTMAKEIPAKQVKKGPEKGSWSPEGDIWAQGGGRLYMTCLCTYMLEVYYRHLPIYSKAF